MSKQTNEERPRYVISLAIRHKQGIEASNELVLDLVKVLRLVIFGDNHAIENVDSVVPQLVMVAQTKVDHMTNKRVEVKLESLQ